MLTELKNGTWIHLADVRSIRVHRLPRETGHEPEWAVRIVHDAEFGYPDHETCVFDSDHSAHAYAADIAAKAKAEQVAAANRTADGDCRRERSLDRVCVLAAGFAASGAGHNKAVWLARKAMAVIEATEPAFEATASPFEVA